MMMVVPLSGLWHSDEVASQASWVSHSNLAKADGMRIGIKIYLKRCTRSKNVVVKFLI